MAIRGGWQSIGKVSAMSVIARFYGKCRERLSPPLALLGPAHFFGDSRSPGVVRPRMLPPSSHAVPTHHGRITNGHRAQSDAHFKPEQPENKPNQMRAHAHDMTNQARLFLVSFFRSGPFGRPLLLRAQRRENLSRPCNQSGPNARFILTEKFTTRV